MHFREKFVREKLRAIVNIFDDVNPAICMEVSILHKVGFLVTFFQSSIHKRTRNSQTLENKIENHRRFKGQKKLISTKL